MSPVENEPDELLDQVLEDEREAALQEFREREELAIDMAKLADASPLPAPLPRRVTQSAQPVRFRSCKCEDAPT
jgi:hypothetical protein